ncbi:MAG: PHP-associated domain-containing protein [bacterium]
MMKTHYIKLKSDLHIHTSADLFEKGLGIETLVSPKKFIDVAAGLGFEVLSFTHHWRLYKDPEIDEYAQKRNILLIPGIEASIEKKHVLLYNCSKEIEDISTFNELKRYKDSRILVIAPHPFYFLSSCLGNSLLHHIDCFDAIEYCHFYCRLINPNRKALKIGKKYNLPIVGNSDSHKIDEFGNTYSYIYVKEKTISGVIEAIKDRRVEYYSQPFPLYSFLGNLMKHSYSHLRFVIKKIIVDPINPLPHE